MNIIEKIRTAARRSQTVPVPEWDCTVNVCAMNAQERAEWGRSQREAPQDAPDTVPAANLLARCVRDDAGELVFPDPATAAELLTVADGVAVERLLAAAYKLNGIGKEAEEAAAKKPETRSGDSGCD